MHKFTNKRGEFEKINLYAFRLIFKNGKSLNGIYDFFDDPKGLHLFLTDL